MKEAKFYILVYKIILSLNSTLPALSFSLYLFNTTLPFSFCIISLSFSTCKEHAYYMWLSENPQADQIEFYLFLSDNSKKPEMFGQTFHAIKDSSQIIEYSEDGL